jgi:AcrR family transcriptional regulator
MGRPRKTTEEHFLAVALRIVDAEGLEALTLRRLGSDVGVASTALYTYFENRQDLIDKLVGSVLADVYATVQPLEGSPRERLVTLAVNARQRLTRHPRLLPALLTMARQVPGAEDAITRVIDTFREAGIGDDDLPVVYRAYESYLLGVTILDVGGAPAHLDIRRRRYKDFPSPAFAPLARSTKAVAANNEEAFRRGVDGLLAGFGV